MTDSITLLIMLAVFLVGTLWLGIKYKKDSHNIIEYTIGNKMFTTSALIATIVATSYGGGALIRTVEMIYADGLWCIIFTIGSVLVCDLARLIVSYRIGIFMEDHVSSKNHISMADTLGQVYGRIPRIITALATVGTSTASMAIQIAVTSRALQICVSDVDPAILMVIAASIMVLYSTFGGIRSVTITDILQCATFTVVIPYVAYKVLRHTGMTVPQIFKAVARLEKFQFAPIFHSKVKTLSLIAACLANARISPAVIQRMYMARNSQQAREAYFRSWILNTVIVCFIVFIGIAARVGYGGLTKPNMIWPTIISDSSAIFKGFFVISLFAMAMSTADSRLNVASSMFAYDLINPLCKNRLTGRQQLYLAKVTSLVIGILAILLALHTRQYGNALLRLLFLYFDIGNPVIVAPFLLAVFGFRCKEKIAVLGMVMGIVTITLWKKFIPDIDGSFVAMLVNGITMLLAHYSLPDRDRQSWQKPSLDYQQSQQARQRRFSRLKKHIASLFSSLQYTPSNSSYIILLAFYILVTSWIPHFSRWQHA